MPYKGPYSRGYETHDLSHWQWVQMCNACCERELGISLYDFLLRLDQGNIDWENEGVTEFGENIMGLEILCRNLTLEDIADTPENRRRGRKLCLVDGDPISPVRYSYDKLWTYEDKGMVKVQ